MKHLFQSVILPLLLAGLLFYSCKKERSCESCQINQPTSNTNKPPIAVAGPDQTISLPKDSILLNGSASNDPDGSITVWQWTKISGPSSFTIINASTVEAQVSNLLQGVYQFELKVTDNAGLPSNDTVQITVLSPTFNGSGVYIAGSGINSATGNTVARIWTNNTLQDLSNGQYDAEALSVFVSGTDIYVAGHERNASGKSEAKLWKNGVSQNLSNGQYNAEARSVLVSATDVYVAGWENNTNGIAVPRLWKNGVVQNLISNGQQGARAFSVFVSGNDVYVAGNVDDTAVIWKNGVSQQLSRVGEGDMAVSVCVSGNDVYAAGGSYNCCPSSGPVLWKNGVVQNLGIPGNGDGDAFSVFVSGSDVYVAGWSSGNGATLWKNSVVQNLGATGNGNAQANAVLVSGSDVYVAGWWQGYTSSVAEAKLWKNAVEYSLSGLTHANSIFVQ